MHVIHHPSPPPPPPPNGWAKPIGTAFAVFCAIIALNCAIWLCLTFSDTNSFFGTTTWIAVFGVCVGLVAVGIGSYAATHRD